MNQSSAPLPVSVPLGISGFPREFSLLCACTGVELGPERVAHIAGASESGVDWNGLIRLAEHHGVLPLVARNLNAQARGLPEPVAQSLRSAYEANARRNLWFASELVRILEHFKKSGLPTVPYKGPVLAESAYGDLALRTFGDLDLLISPSDFVPAKRALGELEYQPSEELDAAVERFWLRYGYERSFDGAAGKYLVELQWAVLPYFYAVDLDSGDLLARSGLTLLGGREVPCLATEDSLLVLCLHAAKHLWMRLQWVCDIAETMRTQAIGYSHVFERARTLGILRILSVSFWLVEHVLGAALPQAARDTIAHDPEIEILGREFAARLARGAGYDFESSEYFRLILKLRERRGDRWRYLWRLLWTPGVGDLGALRLPEALFPLYRVVRFARLARKVF